MNLMDKVRSMIADYKGMKVEDVKAESTFNDLDLDSLDLVELIMQFEDEFKISLEMTDELENVGDLVAYIEKSQV